MLSELVIEGEDLAVAEWDLALPISIEIAMEKPLRILHLEDDPGYAALLNGLLASEGLWAETVLVENLADFVSALKEGVFDIILADYQLRACTGIEALQAARQMCPHTPVLLVSGTSGGQARTESLKHGATNYVSKQCPERLAPAVRRAVLGSEERAKRQQAESELAPSPSGLATAPDELLREGRAANETTFRRYLPVEPDPEIGGAEVEIPASPARGHGETVLVVEDEELVLQLIAKTLNIFGYKVLTAVNGERGLATYLGNQGSIDVVLTDLMMPVMDGISMIRALREVNPRLKIIAGSGLGDQLEAATLHDMNVNHSLSKPYTVEILLRKLQEVLAEGTPPAP